VIVRADWTKGLRFLGALALMLALAFAALGCGDTVIDSGKTEAAIQSNVEKSLNQKVDSVDCPSDQKVETGETFTCTIELSNGKHATSTWKIRNQEADIEIVDFEETK
jgi:post-segregation antitoxin (ccd killing protein)